MVSDAPALGGVYKLVETMEAGQARPTVKLSTGKRTFPGRKQVWRVTEGGIARHDVMGLEDETAQDGRALLSRVMRDGVRVHRAGSPGRSAGSAARRAWRSCRRRCGRSRAGRPTPCASATRWISWRARR